MIEFFSTMSAITVAVILGTIVTFICILSIAIDSDRTKRETQEINENLKEIKELLKMQSYNQPPQEQSNTFIDNQSLK